MTARRAAAILSSIPIAEREQVHLYWIVPGEITAGRVGGAVARRESVAVRFLCLDLLGNVASFSELNGEAHIDVPLDQIQTVWRKSRRGGLSWEVSLIGGLEHTDGEWLHWPPI
jgi:hypothetical protein